MKKKKISQILEEWLSKELKEAPDIHPTQEHYESLEVFQKKQRPFFLSWGFRFAAGGVAAAVLVVLLVFYADIFQKVQPELARDVEETSPKTQAVGGIAAPEEEARPAPRLASSQAENAGKREGKKGPPAASPRAYQAKFQALKFYPFFYEEAPPVSSPFISQDNKQVVIAYSDKGYTLVPVTVGSWESHERYYGKFLKGDQLSVDSDDFPALAESGIHSEEELEKTETITGTPVDEITEMARPEQSSWAGFMAEDEDILSVIRGDNELVKQMDLTHPQMARPLFHVWNALIVFLEQEGVTRDWEPFEFILYNGKRVFVKAMSTRGFQESLFNDEIRGSFDINIWRDLSPEETEYLRGAYPELPQEEWGGVVSKLTRIRIGEMNPYYIQRYGFYEGHTSYRADPVAIACIFGLKTLQEIEAAFSGRLPEALTEHFASPNDSRS